MYTDKDYSYDDLTNGQRKGGDHCSSTWIIIILYVYGNIQWRERFTVLSMISQLSLSC
jgi:hypothetical protein